MTYTRSTTVDPDPNTGDSVYQAIMDLDTDLTAAYANENALLTAVGLKIATSTKGVANGVATLDSGVKIPSAQIPSVAMVPVGTVIMWTTETAPTDYLECAGQDLDTTTYADLFAVIGYTFGGVGSTFKAPDIRGKFIRGWAHGSTNDPDKASRTGGDHVASTQADGFKSHRHLAGSVGGTGQQSAGGTDRTYLMDSTAGSGGLSYTDYQGGNETRPININLMFCIKYR